LVLITTLRDASRCVLQRFELRLPPDSALSRPSNVTLRPADGMRLLLARRRQVEAAPAARETASCPHAFR